MTERLHPPFPMPADPGPSPARAKGLPTFTAGGQSLSKRLTVIVRDRGVERAFHPVFPPDRRAAEVPDWLRHHV